MRNTTYRIYISIGRDVSILYYSHHQPTNQPTYMTNYLSVRLTIEHSRIDEIKNKLLHDVSEWCIYMHGGGTSTITEHFHICIVGTAGERYRKRLRDTFGGGNKVYTVKQFDGELRGFVFYCAHEGTTPIYQGSQWSDIIESVNQEGCYKKRKIDHHFQPKEKRVLDRDWQLTYSNIVAQAVLYQRKYMKGEKSLKRVIKHMIEHTKWRPSRDMYKNGMPPVYQHDFEFRIGDRTEFDMDWWTPKTFT